MKTYNNKVELGVSESLAAIKIRYYSFAFMWYMRTNDFHSK